MVVLVRATASLRLFEQALEEQGLPTYVVGGRGYWSQEQVRDGLAYLAALANPRDETAFYGVLASPFCGAGSDALVLLAQAGREGARGPWAALRDAAGADGAAGPAAWLGAVPPADRDRLLASRRFFAGERSRAERLPPEALLERAITATGYDLAILARAGGERRLANLRKLMRLAREYEQTEGRDLRGFLDFAITQDLAEAREGEAALESDGLDAVRLMTIHRAKGLEFPVVCVADLGRLGAAGRPRLLIGHDGTAGLRLAPLGGGDAVPALAYERLAAEEDRADAEEERRLLYVAMTRARETLILSGGTDAERWPEPRPGGAPLDWIVRAIAGEPRELLRDRRGARARAHLGRARRARALRAQLARHARAGAAARGAARPRASRGRARRDRAPEGAEGDAGAARARAAGAAAALLHRPAGLRALRLPLLPPARARPARRAAAAPPEAPQEARTGLDPLVRGGLAHALLEDDRLRAPGAARRRRRRRARRPPRRRGHGGDVEDLRAIVGAFARSPLAERLAAATAVRREAGFAFSLEPGGGGSLVNGFVDVIATEPGGGRLIVDYKTDRLDGADPAGVLDRDYATQRTVYALAALRDGAPRVDVAYCFLERPGEPVVRGYTAADADALAEQVVSLARGVLDERYEVTERPHRDLCADCPGRRALCSYSEERTLAPPARARSDARG